MSNTDDELDWPHHRPWLAGLLSLLLPGMGQLYNRRYVVGPLTMAAACGFWCGGWGWIVHLYACLMAVMEARRVREWGLSGRSLGDAARQVLKAYPPLDIEPADDASSLLQVALREEEIARVGLRYVMTTHRSLGKADPSAGGVLGAIVLVFWIFMQFWLPFTYERRRRTLRRAYGRLLQHEASGVDEE